MIYRKDAVLMAVAGLLASAGLVKADATELKNASLSLAPVVTADEVAPAPAHDGLVSPLSRGHSSKKRRRGFSAAAASEPVAASGLSRLRSAPSAWKCRRLSSASRSSLDCP